MSSSPHRLLILASLSDEGLAVLRAAPDVVVEQGRWKRADLLTRVNHYDALLVRSGTTIDRELLDRAPRLKLVARLGAGLEGIDLAAATACGVMVMNTPHVNSLALAEYTLALLLAVARPNAEHSRWPSAHATARRPAPGVQLHHKTLGLVGFGDIARLVATRAQAFEMTVLAYDPYVDDALARPLRVTMTQLNDLLARSDFVSLHTALTPDTRHRLGPAEFGHMQPGARLINAASPELIDEAALHAALVSGHLAGAALDGLTTEAADHPLLQLPNVIVTPRLGPHTVEAQRDLSIQVAHQMLAALRGTDYRHVVNLPFTVGPEFARTRPYLDLAEKLGTLHSQLTPDRATGVEIELKGEGLADLVKPVAVALLTGLLRPWLTAPVNYVNAPALAAERGLAVSQTQGLPLAHYAHLISCRVSWAGGQRLIAGTLFDGAEGRLVQMDNFRLDAKLEGLVLVLFSRDVPGVVGHVGTLLQQFNVNIAEWRLGRDQPGGTALSFINLDEPLSDDGLRALRALPEIIEARLVRL